MLTRRRYRMVADAYGSRLPLGLRPIDLQAATWVPLGGRFTLG